LLFAGFLEGVRWMTGHMDFLPWSRVSKDSILYFQYITGFNFGKTLASPEGWGKFLPVLSNYPKRQGQFPAFQA